MPDSNTNNEKDVKKIDETGADKTLSNDKQRGIQIASCDDKQEETFEIEKQEIRIKCPIINEFTDQYNSRICPASCNEKGFCVKGNCRCYAGFSGDDCTSKGEEKYFEIEFLKKELM
jgi:hypothetical protein